MPDIYDYMHWRGDLSIGQDGFNEVDNLILSAFSYVPLEGIIPSNYGSGITIGEAARKFAENEALWKLLRMREDKRLFAEIGQCRRFAGLALHGHVNRINTHEEKQFSAVSVELGDGSLFISYRGTDNTLVGWKEDFNMSFLRQIPAQADAVAYLENIATDFPGPLRLGGHSKGGNLAVYASAFCPPPIQDRIVAVYNNDGPWLQADMVKRPGYAAIRERIHALIPQTSVIGMLFENEGRYTVIRSNQKGLFQHDFYSWEVIGPHFVSLASITNSSTFVDHTITSWLEESDEEQRALFVDALFQIISATGATTLPELKEKWYLSTPAMIKSFINLDKDMHKVIGRALKLLMQAGRKHLPDITSSLRSGAAVKDDAFK
ncbi:MAG: DUF2974 domain-containing protein [Desulfobulbaceae bacterium]|jgi:hypothetical protein|nr:DUF2974 domain-containing protein [Desulfobulbaceae bacterium]